MSGNAEVVDALNALLRGELSAVETYRKALSGLPENFGARAALEYCLRSHEARAAVLREQINVRGGDASPSAGAWGTFARLVEKTAQALGPRMAISALHEGEDHGLREYGAWVSHLDAGARKLVMDELLPAQQETHDQMGMVKATLPAPG